MKRLVVLVSGGGSNLQALIEACATKSIDAEIVAVFSNNPKAFGLTRAKQAGIEAHILDTYNYDVILDYKPDGIILAGYLKIIPADFVNRMKHKIINIHPSLIPSFSGPGFYGAKVHQAALDRGVKYSGATTHFVSEEADGGPIIMQAIVDVKAQDTVDILAKRVLQEEHRILVASVRLYCEDKLRVVSDSVIIVEDK